MFDYERLKISVAEHLFKILRMYKKDDVHFFIQRWLDILRTYTDMENFVGFEPALPILPHLVPRAHAVLIVPTYNNHLPHIPGLSIFPMFPYRIMLQHTNITCNNSMEFLMLYLELTGVDFIGFTKRHYQEESWKSELRQRFPGLKIYGSRSYACFLRKVKVYRQRNSICPRRF